MGRTKFAHMDSMPTPPNHFDSGDTAVCHVCGKALTGRRCWFEVVAGGYIHDPATGPADTSDPGYMGLYPVGPECAKKFETGIIVRAEVEIG